MLIGKIADCCTCLAVYPQLTSVLLCIPNQVSFKLETKRDTAFLFGKARKAIDRYKSDVVCSNLLHSRRYEAWMVTKDKEIWLQLKESKCKELEEEIVLYLLQMMKELAIQNNPKGHLDGKSMEKYVTYEEFEMIPNVTPQSITKQLPIHKFKTPLSVHTRWTMHHVLLLVSYSLDLQNGTFLENIEKFFKF